MMLSIKSNWQHASLERQIKEIDHNQDLTRTGIMIRAINCAEGVANWERIAYLKISPLPDEVEVPVSMQARLDDSTSRALENVKQNIMKSLNIQILQTQYLVKLLLANYLEDLKQKIASVGDSSKASTADMSGSEMVKTLVELIMLNRKADEKAIEDIKEILLEWKRGV